VLTSDAVFRSVGAASGILPPGRLRALNEPFRDRIGKPVADWVIGVIDWVSQNWSWP